MVTCTTRTTTRKPATEFRFADTPPMPVTTGIVVSGEGMLLDTLIDVLYKHTVIGYIAPMGSG